MALQRHHQELAHWPANAKWETVYERWMQWCNCGKIKWLLLSAVVKMNVHDIVAYTYMIKNSTWPSFKHLRQHLQKMIQTLPLIYYLRVPLSGLMLSTQIIWKYWIWPIDHNFTVSESWTSKMLKSESTSWFMTDTAGENCTHQRVMHTLGNYGRKWI